MFILGFGTGVNNSFVFDSAEKAMESFANFLPEFLEPEEFEIASKMHWEKICGESWAWVPNGFVWGPEYGTAWNLKNPFPPIPYAHIIEVEYNPIVLVTG